MTRLGLEEGGCGCEGSAAFLGHEVLVCKAERKPVVQVGSGWR